MGNESGESVVPAIPADGAAGGAGDPSAPWQLTNTHRVIASSFLAVDRGYVIKPSGECEQSYVVRLRPAVMVVVLDEGGEHVLMAFRHRCVPDIWSWELPGGLVEDGEHPADAARRELVEETGHHARTLRHLTTFEPAAGQVASPHHVYLARASTSRNTDPSEPDEGKFAWRALAEVPALIACGHISTSGALVGLLHVLAANAGALTTSA